MKKIFLFFALLAGIAVMTGCQKDQDVVTLKAVIDHDTKAYFGGADANNNLVTPYWDGNDRVYVKGYNSDFTRESCSLELPSENSTTFATISNMPVSNVYCAIYPANAVLDMGTPDAGTNGTTAKITYKHDQVYEWDNDENRQRLEMPMGAVTTDNTLIFKNLCGILRIKVVNKSGSAFDVTRVSVISENGTFIAGDASIKLYKNGDPSIRMSPYDSYTVNQAIQLHTPGGYSSMGTIPSNSNGTSYKTFDIIVPPFSCQKLTFDVETADHGYFTQTVQDNISIDRNDIVTITLTVNSNSLQTNNHAYLIDGPIFNSLIRGNGNDTAGLSGINGITAIKFCNAGFNPDNYSQKVNLAAAYSPLPVYGFIDAASNTLIIYSPAAELYANASCKKMFKDLTSVENVYVTSTLITEDVVDMSYMFAGCRSYHIIGGEGSFIERFNTANVETMAHMFDGCSILNQLDLSSYNTQHLRPNGMVAMFNGCAGLSTLNLSSFTTEQITDMSDLFNGCLIMKTLNIGKFTISSGTTLTNMFNDLNSNGNNNWEGNMCAISCTQNVYDAVHAAGANTGIDETKVRWIIPTTKK